MKLRYIYTCYTLSCNECHLYWKTHAEVQLQRSSYIQNKMIYYNEYIYHTKLDLNKYLIN